MNTATSTHVRLYSAIIARGLSATDVMVDEAVDFAVDVEAEYGQTLTEADWDQVINNYSVSGLVIC
jgi:hypothetical protein